MKHTDPSEEHTTLITSIDDNKLFHTTNIDTITDQIQHLLICEETAIPEGSEVFKQIIKNTFLSSFKPLAEFSSQNLYVLKNYVETFLCDHFAKKQNTLSSLILIAEEILYNAFFHAPHDETGKALYEEKDRFENIILKDKEVDFKIAKSERNILISCKDYFGSLSVSDIFQQIQSGRSNIISDIPNTKKGAGIGLNLVYNYSDILIFKVTRRICTEVFVIKFNDFVGYKLINIFTEQEKTNVHL